AGMSRAAGLPRARKRFGQHFLHDRTILERIVATLAPRPGEHVVEIGPGRGALTAWLAPAVQRAGGATLDVIEIDRDLAAHLASGFAAQGVAVHAADALEFDFAALATARGGPLRVVGNLPYNISTPLLFHLLEQRGAIADLHVMLQREVVDRMVARPGTRAYGRLTIMLAPWTEIERLFDVGPGAFSPPPRVWSSVARLRMRPRPALDVSPCFARLVAAAFSARRKTLRNALRSFVASETIAACGIDPGARPGTLTPQNYAALARAADGL
ncbi:MAG: 16S rRNA (adenine(1518)-N(6)/adenine(1519)-N(6))-dimethyltransferase RsmA, partial [Steroidobacteraceae bacterium]